MTEVSVHLLKAQQYSQKFLIKLWNTENFSEENQKISKPLHTPATV